MAFTLDARLAADTMSLGRLGFVDVRLMRDARFAWLVLVPQIDGAEEWQDLPLEQGRALHDIAMQAANVLREIANADKMNVASLGNMVRQLHIHIIARHEGDAAWPGPVWGVGTSQDYEPHALDMLADKIKRALAL
jgi:diadenosine tetraphosphate (Ap4A) HIT family hydrolase